MSMCKRAAPRARGSRPGSRLLHVAVALIGVAIAFFAVSTGVAAVLQGRWWPFAILPVVLIAVSALVLAIGAALMVAVGKTLWVMPAEDSDRQSRNTTDDEASKPKIQLQWDESIRIKDVHWQSNALPPTLYVDDYTVMSEVKDLHMLREGDHCVVGLNVLHNLFPSIDALVSRLTSWEALPVRLYHHFVLVDSVALVTEDGPLTAHGKPVHIAEFSETPAGAVRRVMADGYHPQKVFANVLAVLISPARYDLRPLSSYLPRRKGSRGNGIFLFHQNLSDKQRQQTRDAALELAALNKEPDAPNYRLLTFNCEHAAFLVSAQTRRWMSPQVSHQLYNGFRLLFQLFSLVFLAGIAYLCPYDHAPKLHGLLAALYHVFATLPVFGQTQVHLVRTAINLTQRRHELGEVVFNYLIVKEAVRSLVVGGLSVISLGRTPRLVWETGCLYTAFFITLMAYGSISVVFNLSVQFLVRVLMRAGVGVPVLIWDDLRHVSDPAQSTPDSSSEVHDAKADTDCPSRETATPFQRLCGRAAGGCRARYTASADHQ